MPRIRPLKLKVDPVDGSNGLAWRFTNTARPTFLFQLDTRQLKRLIHLWYREKSIGEDHYQQIIKFDTLLHFYDDALGYFVAMSTPMNTLWNVWLKDNSPNQVLWKGVRRLLKLENK